MQPFNSVTVFRPVLGRWSASPAGNAPAQPVGRRRRRSRKEDLVEEALGSAPVRIGVVGLRHGARRVRGWEQARGSTVSAVCGLDEERTRAALSDAGPGCVATTRFAQLLENPDVDSVVVSVPNDAHAEFAERALRAGKHVALEKPMATTGEQAAALVRLAEEHGGMCTSPARCGCVGTTLRGRGIGSGRDRAAGCCWT
ncbi:Gfo/Idh/MocA family protein [Streptomyces sp. NPDC088725]|uniref:Gfo/Idh/MocA family protein n=1 Tax=Streptomyces sp. NPDC088725 TaxID=3365873 RepID=UPI00380E79FB